MNVDTHTQLKFSECYKSVLSGCYFTNVRSYFNRNFPQTRFVFVSRKHPLRDFTYIAVGDKYASAVCKTIRQNQQIGWYIYVVPPSMLTHSRSSSWNYVRAVAVAALWRLLLELRRWGRAFAWPAVFAVGSSNLIRADSVTAGGKHCTTQIVHRDWRDGLEGIYIWGRYILKWDKTSYVDHDCIGRFRFIRIPATWENSTGKNSNRGKSHDLGGQFTSSLWSGRQIALSCLCCNLPWWFV